MKHGDHGSMAWCSQGGRVQIDCPWPVKQRDGVYIFWRFRGSNVLHLEKIIKTVVHKELFLCQKHKTKPVVVTLAEWDCHDVI